MFKHRKGKRREQWYDPLNLVSSAVASEQPAVLWSTHSYARSAGRLSGGEVVRKRLMASHTFPSHAAAPTPPRLYLLAEGHIFIE